MEEYEVDLRDYLEVIWKRKWIILLIIVMAVGVAAAYSYTQPNEYKTEGVYKLVSIDQIFPILQMRIPRFRQVDGYNELETVPIQNLMEIDPMSVEQALYILNSNDLIRKAINSEEFSEVRLPEDTTKVELINWVGKRLNAQNPENELIRLKITGAKNPKLLRSILISVTKVFESEVVRHLADQIEQEGFWREERKKTLTADLMKLNDKISQQIENLKAKYQDKIANLQDQIEKMEASEKYKKLKVGENELTMQGFILREHYHSLYQRLVSLEQELDKLELSPRNFLSQLYQKQDSIEEQVNRLDQALDMLNQLKTELPEAKQTIITIESPYLATSAIGPNRKMNIAVAGVLGLFLGTLLAFFVEYMSKPQEENE